VEPGAVLVLVGATVEEDHLTLVPSLVSLAYVREIEGRQAIR